MSPGTVPGGFLGVVPSAGASRRMGSSKALLRLEGRTFVDRAVRALAEGGCAEVVVVVASEDERVAAEAARAGARVLRNPDPGEGPITSLRLAITESGAGAEGIAYLPVDHPLVRSATVSLLLAESRSSGAVLTLPVHAGRRGHPALFRAEVFAELLDPTLEGGARTVVHRRLDAARLVDVDDPGVLADVDTPADLEAVSSGRAPT